MKFFQKSDKTYQSEYDKFLLQFDEDNPQKSPSQQQEIDKYQRIDTMRDTPCRVKKQQEFWDGF